MWRKGEGGEGGGREKQFEEEIVSLRDRLGHLQDECTQVTFILHHMKPVLDAL